MVANKADPKCDVSSAVCTAAATVFSHCFQLRVFQRSLSSLSVDSENGYEMYVSASYEYRVWKVLGRYRPFPRHQVHCRNA